MYMYNMYITAYSNKVGPVHCWALTHKHSHYSNNIAHLYMLHTHRTNTNVQVWLYSHCQGQTSSCWAESRPHHCEGVRLVTLLPPDSPSSQGSSSLLSDSSLPLLPHLPPSPSHCHSLLQRWLVHWTLAVLSYQGSASAGAHRGRPRSLAPDEAGVVSDWSQQQQDWEAQYSVQWHQKWSNAAQTTSLCHPLPQRSDSPTD